MKVQEMIDRAASLFMGADIMIEEEKVIVSIKNGPDWTITPGALEILSNDRDLFEALTIGLRERFLRDFDKHFQDIPATGTFDLYLRGAFASWDRYVKDTGEVRYAALFHEDSDGIERHGLIEVWTDRENPLPVEAEEGEILLNPDDC